MRWATELESSTLGPHWTHRSLSQITDYSDYEFGLLSEE